MEDLRPRKRPTIKETAERNLKLRNIASALTRLGLDLATGKIESDQAAKWLRVLALHIEITREAAIHTATWTWFEGEAAALQEYLTND